jgi:hypothetical protein
MGAKKDFFDLGFFIIGYGEGTRFWEEMDRDYISINSIPVPL